MLRGLGPSEALKISVAFTHVCSASVVDWKRRVNKKKFPKDEKRSLKNLRIISWSKKNQHGKLHTLYTSMFFKVGKKNIFKINTYLKNPEDCTETNVTVVT